MKLLLHICCAPCSAACIKVLRDEGVDVHGYWYNPNIHPYKEYEARLNALKEYSRMINLNVVYYDYYGLREFCENVSDKLNNRCEYCPFLGKDVYTLQLDQLPKMLSSGRQHRHW